MLDRKRRGARWNGDRDRRILLALGRAVLLTVGQVRTLGPFGSREAAARRMRKLSKLGLVRIWKPKDKTRGHQYSVTDAGKERLLVEDEAILPERIHVARRADRRDLDHLARLADLRIALGLACDRREDLIFVEYLGESDLRSVEEERASRLLPDAFAILETAYHPVLQLGVWIEVDRGTESVSRFVKGKLIPLAAHMAARHPVLGAAEWVVLVLVESARRSRLVAEALGGFLQREMVWLSLLEPFLADPFSPVLRPAGVVAVSAVSLSDLLFQRGIPADGTSISPIFVVGTNG